MPRWMLLLSFSLLSTALQAESLRCGSKLVSLGDRAFEVLQKCGEPNYREHTGYSSQQARDYGLPLEEWVYGPRNGMLQILRFQAGKLIRIESKRTP